MSIENIITCKFILFLVAVLFLITNIIWFCFLVKFCICNTKYLFRTENKLHFRFNYNFIKMIFVIYSISYIASYYMYIVA